MHAVRLHLPIALGLICVLLASPSATASSAWMKPADLRSAYDVNPLLANGYTGKGVTVAVINSGVDSTFYADVEGFSSEFNLPAPSISVLTPFGSVGTDAEQPPGETTADVEFVHAMAPDARILLVLTGNSTFARLLDGFSYVIDHDAADVAVVSPSAWYAPGYSGQQTVESYNTEYARSVGENITLIAASNDFGSNNTVPFGGTVPCAGCYMMPQSSPYVTAVGGTNLFVDGSGSRVSETGWNQSSGGPSYVFPQPSWQVGRGVPNNGLRDMPDIALDSSCSTPYSFFWKGSPNSYFCGTSAAAPTFAGIVADIDQAAGHSLGFLNPSLYSIASSDPAAFHDVTSGCSLVESGSTASTGYCAGPGWDFVTGLGSIDAARLAVDLVPGLSLTITTTTTAGTATATTTASSSTTTPGGIPEFPFQLVAAVAFISVLTVGYAFFRRRLSHSTA